MGQFHKPTSASSYILPPLPTLPDKIQAKTQLPPNNPAPMVLRPPAELWKDVLGIVQNRSGAQSPVKQNAVELHEVKPMQNQAGKTLTHLPFIQPDGNTQETELQPALFFEAGVSEAAKEAVSAVPGRHWLGKMESNAQREVALMIPEGTDLNAPVEVIFYFHGHHGTIANGLSEKALGAKLLELAKDPQRNVVLVMPQGPPKPALLVG